MQPERDSLPGLITALGHTPVRFEDFGPQSTPSRQACLDGVTSSDVYLMLLGPIYRYRFPETNQSPTHDEFVAAQAAGIPRLVFCKAEVAFEAEQEEFAKLVGDYGTGVFYSTFDNATDLQAKVVAAAVSARSRSRALPPSRRRRSDRPVSAPRPARAPWEIGTIPTV